MGRFPKTDILPVLCYFLNDFAEPLWSDPSFNSVANFFNTITFAQDSLIQRMARPDLLGYFSQLSSAERVSGKTLPHHQTRDNSVHCTSHEYCTVHGPVQCNICVPCSAVTVGGCGVVVEDNRHALLRTVEKSSHVWPQRTIQLGNLDTLKCA